MIGVDEVGRGCLAGPLLVVAANATSRLPDGLRDSKLLSRRQRVKLLDLLSISCSFGEGWVEPSEIDKFGLAEGMRLGTARALTALRVEQSDEIVMDGKLNYAPPGFTKVSCVIKADSRVPLVSAAAIFAKVQRDWYMQSLKYLYPAYGFERHVGYGTAAHIDAIASHGLIKGIHRESFKIKNRSVV